MQRTQEQKKLISCLHLIFQAVRKYVMKLVDILANFICIHGGIYFFEKFRQIYFSEMCPSLSIIVMGDLSFDPVSIKPAVSWQALGCGGGSAAPGSYISSEIILYCLYKLRFLGYEIFLSILWYRISIPVKARGKDIIFLVCTAGSFCPNKILYGNS